MSGNKCPYVLLPIPTKPPVIVGLDPTISKRRSPGRASLRPRMTMRGWFGHHPELRHAVPEDDDEGRMFSLAIF